MDTNYFANLKTIDVSDFAKEKGGFTYLPWAKAIELLLDKDPSATWKFEPDQWLPNRTVIVTCEITAFGVTRTMHMPVWETAYVKNRRKNRGIENPDAFDISNARMRCLVKAIALYGIGLHLFTQDYEDEADSAPKSEKASGTDGDHKAEGVPTSKVSKTPPTPVTLRGQKIMEKCMQLGVSRKELEIALGCDVDKVDETMMSHLKAFLSSVAEDTSLKQDHLKKLYDNIHDIA